MLPIILTVTKGLNTLIHGRYTLCSLDPKERRYIYQRPWIDIRESSDIFSKPAAPDDHRELIDISED